MNAVRQQQWPKQVGEMPEPIGGSIHTSTHDHASNHHMTFVDHNGKVIRGAV